jgi:MoaA/NifB/PqqE/SkfB family radical SAM enzyme
MCHRWQKKAEQEISLNEIRTVFQNRLFSRVEEVNLHGGEPTLRSDLAEICRVIQDACPKLRRLWISTNGFGTRRIEERIQQILTVLDFDRLDELGINVSIDGLEDTHDRIRGVKGGFRQCLATVHMVKKITQGFPVKISLGTVIQPFNLGQIDDLEKLAMDLEVPIFFQPLRYDKFFNIADPAGVAFTDQERDSLKTIIRDKLTVGSSAESFYWCDFLSLMNGKRRKSPCAFDRYVLSLYPTGEVLPCSQEDWIMFGNVYDQAVDQIWRGDQAKAVRRRMKKEVCPTCPSYCGFEFSVRKEFFSYALFYLKKKVGLS